MSLIQLVKPASVAPKFQSAGPSAPQPAPEQHAAPPAAQSLPAVPGSLAMVYFAASARLKQAQSIARTSLTVEQFNQENEVLT